MNYQLQTVCNRCGYKKGILDYNPIMTNKVLRLLLKLSDIIKPIKFWLFHKYAQFICLRCGCNNNHPSYGAWQMLSKTQGGVIGTLTQPLDDKTLEAFTKDYNNEQIIKDKSYLCIWNEETSQVECKLGQMPE